MAHSKRITRAASSRLHDASRKKTATLCAPDLSEETKFEFEEEVYRVIGGPKKGQLMIFGYFNPSNTRVYLIEFEPPADAKYKCYCCDKRSRESKDGTKTVCIRHPAAGFWANIRDVELLKPPYSLALRKKLAKRVPQAGPLVLDMLFRQAAAGAREGLYCKGKPPAVGTALYRAVQMEGHRRPCRLYPAPCPPVSKSSYPEPLPENPWKGPLTRSRSHFLTDLSKHTSRANSSKLR